MKDNSRNGVIGAVLIGLGCGLAAVGVAMVIPAWTNWSLGLFDQVVKKSRESLTTGVETAAEFAGQLKDTAQRRFEEASKTARQTTVKAASAVETAARRVREHASGA